MPPSSPTEPAGAAPLRVRTVRPGNHHFRLGIDLGQRNVVFVGRPLTLRKFIGWSQAVAIVPEPGYDLVHLVNAVPLAGRKPYLISFENFLPRVPEDTYIGWLERFLQRRLLADARSGRCLSLLAMSHFAVRQFRRQNRDFAGRTELEELMQVLYPAIEPPTAEPKRHSKEISLLFVGFNFMGKGGPALLRAHEELRGRGLPVRTTVVSSLSWTEDDFLGPPSRDYVDSELRRLGSERVTHYRSLPNPEVLELMRASDYLVLPTLHDTFGYVAIEALSRGTPVIATDTCALPEIVEDGRCGFLLPFERDDDVGRWRHLYKTAEPDYLENFERAIALLTGGIVDAVERGWERRDAYEELSAQAIERVRTRFSRAYGCAVLEGIYARARG
jgi:glycosyltransferase involved in cell wall biosynthesis